MSIWLLRPIASFFSTGLPYQFAPSNILVRPFLYQLALKYSISYFSLRNVSFVFLQKSLACSLAENMSINLKQCRKLKLNAKSWNWVQKVEFHWLTNKFLKYRKEKKERTDSVGESNNFSVQKSRVNKKNKSTQQGKNKYGMEAPNIILEGKDKKDDWRDNRGFG